jgi:hypothetical protein
MVRDMASDFAKKGLCGDLVQEKPGRLFFNPIIPGRNFTNSPRTFLGSLNAIL